MINEKYKYLNQQRIIMDKDATPTNSSESLTIPFAGQMLSIYEPATGKISISFDQITRSLRYQVKDYSLDKINFKTVLAGLKNTHPQIISAHLNQNQEAKYELSVVVSYEFLPEVRENIVFESRTIPKEQSEQANVRNLRNHIKGMKQQLISLGNLQTVSGALDQSADTEIFVPLNNKKTVFTLSLSLTNIHNPLLKVQMYYYNSVSKNRKSSGAVPQEGIFLHHNGNAFTQIKFFAQFQDFDMVNFRVQGKNKGDYILSAEKVEVF